MDSKRRKGESWGWSFCLVQRPCPSTETVPSMSDTAIGTIPLPARSASRRTYSQPRRDLPHHFFVVSHDVRSPAEEAFIPGTLASWNLRPRLQRRGRSHPLPQLVTVRSSATSCRRQRNRPIRTQDCEPERANRMSAGLHPPKQVAPPIAAGAGWNAPRLDSAVYRARRWPTARSLIFRRRSS